MNEASINIAKDKEGRTWMRVESVATLLRKVADNVRAMPGGVILSEQLDEVLQEVAAQIEKGHI